MSRQAGQAALEYLGLVALVVLVLAAAVAATGRAGHLASAVVAQVHRALCVVAGGDCERDRAPCVVSARGERSRVSGRLAIIRLGSGWAALVEERSDGSWVVSRVREDGGGIEVSVGARGELALGDLGRVGAGGEARAAALAHADGGLSWTVGTRAQAHALLRTLRADQVATLSGPSLGRLVADRLVDLPPPDEVLGERGWRVALDAGADAAVGELDAGSGSLELTAGEIAGTRRRRDGSRVVYLRRSAAVVAALEAGAAGERSGARASDVTVGLELDRRGAPVSLSVLETGALRDVRDVPAAARPIAAALAARGEGPRRFEVVRHLDLTVPVHRRVAGALVGEVLAGGLRAAVPAAALRRLLDEEAVVDARVYGVDGRSWGVEAEGPGFGLEATHEVATARLLAAATRGIDGRWTGREDCLRAA